MALFFFAKNTLSFMMNYILGGETMNRKTYKKQDRGFVAYLKRTFANKIIAILLGIIGWVATFIDNDATIFVFLMLIAVPLFFARTNWIMKD